MSEANGPSLGGRVLLALLTVYALAMIAPDFVRLARPLGSLGLATNADGLIYDVRGPFATDEGVRPRGRQDCVSATGSTLPRCAASR